MGRAVTQAPISLDSKRDQRAYDAAQLALLVKEYVPEAIGTLVKLMREGRREQVRFRACAKLIELSVGDQKAEQEPEGAKIYILATHPEGSQSPDALADELRKRLGR